MNTFEIQEKLKDEISELDRLTKEWFDSAAQGKASWICPDCCTAFPDGMPAECIHSDRSCSKWLIRQRTK